jgi:hypothetical protein
VVFETKRRPSGTRRAGDTDRPRHSRPAKSMKSRRNLPRLQPHLNLTPRVALSHTFRHNVSIFTCSTPVFQRCKIKSSILPSLCTVWLLQQHLPCLPPLSSLGYLVRLDARFVDLGTAVQIVFTCYRPYFWRTTTGVDVFQHRGLAFETPSKIIIQ